MRLGVLSDLHCELEPTGSRWINDFEPDQLDRRTDEALRWFSEAEVDLILLLGDIVQFETRRDLSHMFAGVAAAEVAPLATVNGNHDLRLGAAFAECAHEHGIRLLYEEPLELGGIAVTGVAVERGPAPPQYVGRFGGWETKSTWSSWRRTFRSCPRRPGLPRPGLPYAGDLVNRADLEGRLGADPLPKVLLSGHIHARCSAHHGPLLQCTVGAADRATIRRDDRRDRRGGRQRPANSPSLGEIAVTDPVFAADDERWQWVDGRWETQRVAPSAASTSELSQT